MDAGEATRQVLFAVGDDWQSINCSAGADLPVLGRHSGADLSTPRGWKLIRAAVVRDCPAISENIALTRAGSQTP
jgi:hypothetical protein